jgi:hypothetical protein
VTDALSKYHSVVSATRRFVNNRGVPDSTTFNAGNFHSENAVELDAEILLEDGRRGTVTEVVAHNEEIGVGYLHVELLD